MEAALGIWLAIGFRNKPMKYPHLIVVLVMAFNRSASKIFNATTFKIDRGAFIRTTGPFFAWRGKRLKLPLSEIHALEIVGTGDDDLKLEILTYGQKRYEIDWNMERHQAEASKAWLRSQIPHII